MLLFPSPAGRINARMPSSGATPEGVRFPEALPRVPPTSSRIDQP
jgi:hypothetical protein